jgi:hypothetical protein
MMLPLETRTNRLLSIHVRSITLEFDKYKIQITTEDGRSTYSNETEMTLVLILYLKYFSCLNLKWTDIMLSCLNFF